MTPFGIIIVVLSVLFCCHSGEVLGDTCNFNVKVKQALLNEGFHRNITYGVLFSADNDQDQWLFKDCILGVDQTLPSGVYANPDELVDLRRQDRLNAIPKQRINVELPAEDSEPSGAYVIGKVTASRVYLWLPVHARYHRARAGGGTAVNEIPAPDLYLRCPDQRLDACSRHIPAAVTFLCNGSSKEKCSWKKIPFTMLTSPLKWSVPVGNTDHYYAVCAGTASIVALGAAYLVTTVHRHKLRAAKKQC